MKQDRSPNARHPRARFALGALLACSASACFVKHEGPQDSDTTTNWLHACKRNTDCRGESSCLSGTCSLACSPKVEAACSSLAAEAECVEVEQAAAQCDVPCRFDRACDSLGDGYACQEGLCRPRVDIAREDKERPAEMDASVPVVAPPTAVLPGFDATVIIPYDAAADGGLTDSGVYYPFASDADAGPACPTEYPAVTWQPPAWEPFVTDAGRDERFRIVQETMLGRWHGLATPSWPKPYLVDLEFKADGHYSGRCSEIIYPCCRSFNGGTDEEHELKQYHLLDALASGYLVGDIDIVNDYGDMFSLSPTPGRLSYVERDRSGNGLRFQYRHGNEGSLVKFDLRRVSGP